MDFLDPKKKRKHRIRLFIGYGLMAILIGLGATILLFEASGFDINRRTGELIHNGLVFVDAHPQAAEVYLNGEHQGRTDTRLVIPEGTYDLELRRDGYRTWRQEFQLQGSTIERFVYPFLFPTELKPEDVQLYAKQPAMATQSPDRRWLMIQRPDTLTQFEIIDLRTKNTDMKVLTLPGTLLTKSVESKSIEAVEWSTNNRHVLMKHVYKGGVEYFVIDHRAPEKSINLNKLFKEPFTKAVLHDKQPDQFYLFNQPKGILRQADSDTGLTEPFLNNVLEFNTHGSKMVLYVTKGGVAADSVSVVLRDGDQEYKIRELPKDDEYLVNMARFDGSWYTAMGSKKEKKVYVYADVVDKLKQSEESLHAPVPTAILRSEKPEYLTISTNARFIALQGDSAMSIYDAETERIRRYNIQPKLSSGQKLTWMDGHRLTTVVDGKVVVMDFDGTNKQQLAESGKGFAPFFDRDYKVMYTVGPSSVVPGRSALVRTPLVVTKN